MLFNLVQQVKKNNEKMEPDNFLSVDSRSRTTYVPAINALASRSDRFGVHRTVKVG